MLDKEVITKLNQPLDPSRVKHRAGGGGLQLAYLKGHNVIDQANDIFGFGGWGYDILMVELCNVVGENGEIIGGYYAARVKLSVAGCVPITEEGVCPIQEGRNPRAKIDAHDMARKGAVTDAMKRAFRCYGDQFGNSLYDSDLIDGQPRPEGQQTPTPATNRPTAPTPARTVNPTPQPQASPRTPQNGPAPAPVTATQPQPIKAPAAAYRMEDDANFKDYAVKIHAANSLKELSDLQPVIKKNVVDRSVLVALRAEYDKRESTLLDIANAKVDQFAGSFK